MSDCRVPMLEYSKELLKNEEHDLPPIPEGWMAVSIPDSYLSVYQSVDDGFKVTIESVRLGTVFKGEKDFNPRSKADVLVLIRERNDD